MSFGLGFWAAAGGGGPQTYEQIATVFGTGGSTSVTFSSIPTGVYKHLQIRGAYRYIGSGGAQAFNITFNGDTGSNYSHHRLLGNGSSVSSTGGSNQSSIFAGFISDNFGGIVLDVLDAFDTNKFKTTRALMGALAGVNEIHLTSGNWRNTSAVTSITLDSPASGISSGSRFTLYGIRG
jgi:hypothetical protein